MRVLPCVASLALVWAGATQAAAQDASAPDLLRADAGWTGDLDALTRYEIDQAIDDTRGVVRANLTLTTTNLTGAPLAALPLLLHPNAAIEQGVPAAEAGRLTITRATAVEGPALTLEEVRPTLVRLRFERPLAPGERVVVRVAYRVDLRRLQANVNDAFAQAQASLGSMGGRGASDYGLAGVGDGILTLALAYPALAPWREGAYDTGGAARIGDLAYNQVASFRVRSVFAGGLRLVSNLVDGAPRPGPVEGSQVIESRGAPVRDLVLVAGRDLERDSREVGATRVTSVYRQRDARAGRLALEVAAEALASYERRFGPYPYAELDVAEASLVGGAGGVEFSGMVLIAGMLYRPPEESTSPLAMYMRVLEQYQTLLEDDGRPRRPGQDAPRPPSPGGELLLEQLEFTVAHEVAHQYFAGLIGNDAHRHPALDEPLAQYLAGLAYADRHGEAARAGAMDRNVKLNYAVYRMLGGRDRPALQDTDRFGSGLEYAALVYGKAPYLYLALEERLGPEQLHAALRATIDRHRFQIVSLPDWIDDLETAAGGPQSGVRAAYRRWLGETHGDEDLGVDDSGDLVFEAMFGPGMARTVKDGLRQLGMEPRDYLRSMLGGGLGDEGPRGPDLDLEEALRALEEGLGDEPGRREDGR
jgi:Peptidase family M1 domain